MTVVIDCVIDNGSIRPLDQTKLKEWKDAHKQGEHFEMILSDLTNTALKPMAKKFFSVRDQYAYLNGYSKDYAKAELQHLFGVIYPKDSPPENREVRLIRAYGELEWQLSLKEYTDDELSVLLDQSERALAEASI